MLAARTVTPKDDPRNRRSAVGRPVLEHGDAASCLMVDDHNRLCCRSNAVRGSPLQLEGPISDVRLREDNKQKGMIKFFHTS